MCRREGQTEIEVTNLSKSPAEAESATECQDKKREEGERESREKPAAGDSSVYSPLMVPIGGDGGNLA